MTIIINLLLLLLSLAMAIASVVSVFAANWAHAVGFAIIAYVALFVVRWFPRF